MGYFSNGTEGMEYQAKYCDKCFHDRHGQCPVWLVHLISNYKENDRKDSVLHQLIPRTEDGLGNKQCVGFLEDKEVEPPLRPGQLAALRK